MRSFINKKNNDQRRVAGAAGVVGFVAGAATVAAGAALSNKKTRAKIAEKARKLNHKKDEYAKKLKDPDKKAVKAKIVSSKNISTKN